MLAGARDFLMKPFSGDELVTAIRRVYETRPAHHTVTAVVPARQSSNTNNRREAAPPREGKIIAVFSPKGGIGCTTVAVNLGVAMAESGNNTVLFDGSLQFGDVAVMLNLKSSTTVIDLMERMNELDYDLVGSVITSHNSGLKVLLAPSRPEMAELVTEAHIKTLLQALRQMYDFIIIDTASNLNDVNLAMLDVADRIVLVTQQNLPSLKNVSRFYDLSEGLDYPIDKVMLVVNHASNKLSISIEDIGKSLKRQISGVIPEDEFAYAAADQGKPLVSGSRPRRPSAAYSLQQLAHQIVEQLAEDEEETAMASVGDSSRLSRLFGR
jgi:pilus assembly protein CpaE